MIAEPLVVERLALDHVEAGGGDPARSRARRAGPSRRRNGPRAVLIRMAPGRIRAIVSALIRWSGRLVEVAVQADEVALLEQLVERVDPADAQGLVHPLAEVGVVEDDVEPQGLGPHGGRRADPAAADQARASCRGAGACRRRSGSASSRPDRLVAGDQPAGEGQQEHDRVVGHLLGAVVGHVADDHAVPGRRLEVDVVVADAGADDAPALRARAKLASPRSGDVVEEHDRVGLGQVVGELLLVAWPGQHEVGDVAAGRATRSTSRRESRRSPR